MFHARIVSPEGSLYFAAETTPYDLENLRSHVHDLQGSRAQAVRLELSIDGGADAADRQLAALVSTLMAEGVQVQYLPVVGGASHGKRALARAGRSV
jgi:hypothetical protein